VTLSSLLARWKGNDDVGYNIEVSKKGDNYFSVLTVSGEVILTIISPPNISGTNIDVGLGANISEISGNVDVKRDTNIQYNRPIILFKKNNEAGLSLESVLPMFQSKIKEKDPNQELFKVNYDALRSDNVRQLKGESQITVGSSILDVSNKDINLRPIPKLPPIDKKIIEMILQYIINSLYHGEETYRANVLMYDPRVKTLKIMAAYHMEGYVDENIEFPVETGASGEAFRENKLVIADLMMRPHADYKIDPTKVWKEMRSIISVPIIDSEEMIAGVLSVDSNQFYTTAKFHDDNTQRLLRLQSKIIGRIIEYMQLVNV
jgi:GAF domain